MSDKEFDKQFRNKFEDFESEPSAFVWADIDAELTASEKKPFPWFNVAAASMAAILAAGIWFAPHKQPMKLYSKVKAQQQETVLEEQPQAIDASAYAVVETEEAPMVAREIADAPIRVARVNVKREKAQSRPVEEVAMIAESPQVFNNPIEARQGDLVSIATASVSNDALSGKMETGNVLAFHSLPEDTTSGRSKHKIRSVGDLVNFVVSKVDKRKNKIIEFSKDDEGEEISGLNLGVLQYRTRNN